MIFILLNPIEPRFDKVRQIQAEQKVKSSHAQEMINRVLLSSKFFEKIGLETFGLTYIVAMPLALCFVVAFVANIVQHPSELHAITDKPCYQPSPLWFIPVNVLWDLFVLVLLASLERFFLSLDK